MSVRGRAVAIGFPDERKSCFGFFFDDDETGENSVFQAYGSCWISGFAPRRLEEITIDDLPEFYRQQLCKYKGIQVFLSPILEADDIIVLWRKGEEWARTLPVEPKPPKEKRHKKPAVNPQASAQLAEEWRPTIRRGRALGIRRPQDRRFRYLGLFFESTGGRTVFRSVREYLEIVPRPLDEVTADDLSAFYRRRIAPDAEVVISPILEAADLATLWDKGRAWVKRLRKEQLTSRG